MLAGCGGDPCDSTPSGAQPQVQLGIPATQMGTFAPFADGSSHTMVFGSQGGFHVWLQTRVFGVCSSDLTVERAALTADGFMVSTRTAVETLVPVAGQAGWSQTVAGEQAYLCPPPPGANLAKGPVQIEVNVKDRTGRSAMMSEHITLACPMLMNDPDLINTCHFVCGI
jgi:hypothetical protein